MTRKLISGRWPLPLHLLLRLALKQRQLQLHPRRIERHTLQMQILDDLLDDLVVAMEVLRRIGQRFRIGLGRLARKAQLFRRPKTEQMVASCLDSEGEFLLVLEILLEALLAVVEIGHGYFP